MKKLYFLALAAFLYAACNNQPDPEPQPPTFEEQFCKKWECWKLMFGEIEREMEEDEITYMTFLEDGKMLLETTGSDDVEIYHWRKRADNEVTIVIPSPTADISEAFEQFPVLGLDAGSFRDTLTIDASITELTDTTMVMNGDIVWKDMFTEEAAERLSTGIFKSFLENTTNCTLYFRRETMQTPPTPLKGRANKDEECTRSDRSLKI